MIAPHGPARAIVLSRGIIVAVLGLWLAGGFALAQEPSDAIIARVNGEALLLSQLREAALDQDIPLASLVLDGSGGEGFSRALTQLIDETLLVQRARTENIEVSDMEVARQVDSMLVSLRRQLGSDKALDEFLTAHQLDLDALKRLMEKRERRRTLATQVVARRVQIDADSLKAFVEKRKAAGQTLEEVDLAQIFIRCPEAQRKTEAGQAIAQRALTAARQAAAEPERFPDFVRQYGDDAEQVDRGGQLGWIAPQSLLPELGQAISRLQPGQVSPPVASPEGFHIFKLQGRRGERDIMFIEEFKKERAKLLEELRRDASVQLYNPSAAGVASQVRSPKTEDTLTSGS